MTDHLQFQKNGQANKPVCFFGERNHSLIVSHLPAHWPCVHALKSNVGTHNFRLNCKYKRPRSHWGLSVSQHQHYRDSAGMQLVMRLIPGPLTEHSSSTQVLYLLLKSALLLPNGDHSAPTVLQSPLLLHTCHAIFHIRLGGIPLHAPVALPTLYLQFIEGSLVAIFLLY